MTLETTDTERRDGATARRRHPKALEMARRGLDLVQTRTNDLADAVYEQDVDKYLSTERFEREVDVLFHKNPVFAGFSVELPGPGTFKTLDLPRRPLIISRDDDGELHALFNVCRHRGSTLTTAASGATRAFVCKYHSWTYDITGRLRRVRADQNFGDVDLPCTSLIRVAVAEKHGMIFVRATPLTEDDRPLDVDEILGDLAPQLAAWRFDTLDVGPDQRTIDADANWKLCLDTHLETYHFSSLHKTTVAKSNNSDFTPFDTYGAHMLNAFTTRTIRRLEEQEEDEWQPLKAVQMVYVLFPGTIMTVMQDHTEYSMVLPRNGIRETKMVHRYFPWPEFQDQEVHQERFDKTFWILDAEDYPMAEEMQRNVELGALDHLLFGRTEPGLQHLHRTMDAALAEGSWSAVG